MLNVVAYLLVRRPQRRRLTSDPLANPDPARPVPEAANLGVARPPLVYLGSIALGVILHRARPVSLLPRGVSPRMGAPVVLLAIGMFLKVPLKDHKALVGQGV